MAVSLKRSFEKCFSVELSPFKRIRLDLQENSDVSGVFERSVRRNPDPSGACQDELTRLERKALLDAPHPQTDEESSPLQGGVLQRSVRLESNPLGVLQDDVSGRELKASIDASHSQIFVESPPLPRGIFQRALAKKPLSAFEQVRARELGLGRPFSEPLQHYFEKGKRLLLEGKTEEAVKQLWVAKNSCGPRSPKTVSTLTQIAHLEVSHQLYSGALETLEMLGERAPSYKPLANLLLSLSWLRLGNRGKFRGFFDEFKGKWLSWTLFFPVGYPLTVEQSEIYIQALNHVSDELDVLRHQELSTRLEIALLDGLFYLYLMRDRLNETDPILRQLEEIDPERSSFLRCLKNLKSFDSTEKEEAILHLQRFRIDWMSKSPLNDLVLLKFLFNEGLQTLDRLPLEIALANYLSFEPHLQDPKEQVFVKRSIFACYFGLNQMDKALEVAQTMEFLQPGSAALPLALCRLEQATTLSPGIEEDFEKCLEARDDLYQDPSFLQMVGDFLQYKRMTLPNAGSLSAVALEFYRWASSFHGEKSPQDLQSNFTQRQLGHFRYLYKQSQFETALQLGRNLSNLIFDNDFLLLEIGLCLFKLGRSQEGVDQLREVLEHKLKSQEDGFDTPSLKESRLIESIRWLRKVGAGALATQYEAWLEETREED